VYYIQFYSILAIKPTNRIFDVRIKLWASRWWFSKSSHNLEYFSYVGHLHTSNRKKVMTIWKLVILAIFDHFSIFHSTVPFFLKYSKFTDKGLKMVIFCEIRQKSGEFLNPPPRILGSLPWVGPNFKVIHRTQMRKN